MAMNLRSIFKLNNLMKNVVLKSNFKIVGLRSIFSERDLGVTGYENTRFLFRNQFVTIEDVFRNKMRDLCNQENSLLYTEDLKAMLHLVQSNDDDINLMVKMLEKYAAMNASDKIGAYIYGPVAMRMFYYLNKPKAAMSVFCNEKLKDAFLYSSCCRILLCLLLKHNMFKEVRDMYEYIVNAKGYAFASCANIILSIACYKENSLEALEYGSQVWRHDVEGGRPRNRSTVLLAYLATKQNDYRRALEMLSTISLENNYSVKNMKILVYMEMGNFCNIIPHLRFVLSKQDGAGRMKLFYDVITRLEKKVSVLETPESSEIMQLIEEIHTTDCIFKNNTLEEYLCKPVILKNQKDERMRNRRFQDDKNMFREEHQMKHYV